MTGHPDGATPSGTQDHPEVAQFLNRLSRIAEDPCIEARTLFKPSGRVIVTRAPGRLDVMGGIADYSGSLVLQLPIREATLVAFQPTDDAEIRIISPTNGDADERAGRSSSFTLSLEQLREGDGWISYEEARRFFGRDSRQAWAAYVAGAFLVLMRERDAAPRGGARIFIDSSVPEGKGVSSSAALEVAVMRALAEAWEVRISARDLALLCQVIENRIVGAPCGVMDQMTSSAGESNQLLALRCQPAEIEGVVAVPPGVEFWGIDSGVRHSVSGADYGSVRVGAFMGYRMIADQNGIPVEEAEPGRWLPRDRRWNGFLANITPSEFEQFLVGALPEQMSGAEFLVRFRGFTDSVTRIDPARTYPVRAPTAHPIYENFRVRAFAELLSSAGRERSAELLGELMYQSHASYSACGLGSEATDRIVALARAAGQGRGVYGAKITGGGSGGTVALLTRSGGGEAVSQIAGAYAGETGLRPYIFGGSSPGAAAFGARTVERRNSI